MTRRRLLATGLAAFCAYFAMYAFRKPIAVATFDDQAGLLGIWGYKSSLVLAQAIGYALSKMLGVRIVAEHSPRHRARLIAALVGAAWLALLAFALLPARLGPLCLFLNGLPLGMIWGLVFSYLEGRRASELLAAMLTASFILSSGVTRSAGALLLQRGVSPFWMPSLTGLMFAPLLLAALAVLAHTPPPDANDRAERGTRGAMDRAARRRYLRRHAIPVAALVTGYTLLAALRDFRDNFAAELWRELDMGGSPAIFSLTEIPVTIVVLAGLAGLALICDNLRALMAVHGAILAGACLIAGGTLCLRVGLFGPVTWTIVIGIGVYLAYAPYSAVLFDRMMALGTRTGNAGFLIYLADSLGYAGSAGLLLLRHVAHPDMRWLSFFLHAAMATGLILAATTLVSAGWFLRRFRDRPADRPPDRQHRR